MDEFLRLARKLAKGDALSVSEDTQLFALRDRLLAEAALFSAIKCVQRTHYAPAASGISPILQAPHP